MTREERLKKIRADIQVLKEDKVNSKSLCYSCVNDKCIFQTGIVRKDCDFYKSERNCHFCDHLKDKYCEVLDLQPFYPERGCDYFKPRRISDIQEIYDEIKDLKERVETLEKQIIESKKEEIKKLEAELYYAKFRSALSDMMSDSRRGRMWKCERCGKLIPYMSDFCHECTDEILGEPPKPFEPTESEEV